MLSNIFKRPEIEYKDIIQIEKLYNRSWRKRVCEPDVGNYESYLVQTYIKFEGYVYKEKQVEKQKKKLEKMIQKTLIMRI